MLPNNSPIKLVSPFTGFLTLLTKSVAASAVTNFSPPTPVTSDRPASNAALLAFPCSAIAFAAACWFL